MSKLWKMRKDILSKLNEFQIYNSLYKIMPMNSDVNHPDIGQLSVFDTSSDGDRGGQTPDGGKNRRKSLNFVIFIKKYTYTHTPACYYAGSNICDVRCHATMSLDVIKCHQLLYCISRTIVSYTLIIASVKS